MGLDVFDLTGKVAIVTGGYKGMPRKLFQVISILTRRLDGETTCGVLS